MFTRPSALKDSFLPTLRTIENKVEKREETSSSSVVETGMDKKMGLLSQGVKSDNYSDYYPDENINPYHVIYALVFVVIVLLAIILSLLDKQANKLEKIEYALMFHCLKKQ